MGARFFSPCLNEAKLYRRAAGYFSSMALLTWSDALPRLVEGNDLEVRLIASPELSTQDIAVFKELADDDRREEYRRMVVERMLDEVISIVESPSDQGARARMFAWLVANERLHVRFAFARHLDSAGVFHEKIGVFDFPNGDRVAFTGSANETLGGHRLNYESIDVYRSWIEGDELRVGTKLAQFEEAWRNEAAGLDVESPTAETVARLRARAPKTFPLAPGLSQSRDEASRRRWRHQDEAVDAFIAERAGVLEMATGTGKTYTALKILSRLIEREALAAAVVRNGRDRPARPVGYRVGRLGAENRSRLDNLPTL